MNIDFGDLDEIVSRSKKDKIKDIMEDLGDLRNLDGKDKKDPF